MDAKSIRKFIMQYAIYIVLVLLVAVIAFQSPNFLSLNNLRNILIMSSTRIILALGVGGILITQGTDLSAGRMVGLAAVLSASLMQTLEYSRRFYPDLPLISVLVPIVLCVVVGALFGFFNGVVVSKLNVPPFIATLGMMVIVYGINSIYFAMEPNSSQPIGGLRSDFTILGTGYIGSGEYSIPYIVLIALAVSVLVWVLFNKTTIGKYLYAIGGNPQAARVSGINVVGVLIFVYTFAGAMYGLAGLLEAARTGGATNNYGNMYELDAIAACVVGGVSTSGGIGTVPGMVAGVLIFSVINYGLTFIGVNPYWQQIDRKSVV